jgi:predicted Zn-dependent protease
VTGKRTSPITRTALVALALVVIAWLAVGLRSAVPETRAQKLVQQHELGGSGGARAQRLFVDARELNPDTRPRVAEAALLLATNRRREAIRVLRPVVRREPDNARAWGILADATAHVDARESARAYAQLRRLEPPVGH